MQQRKSLNINNSTRSANINLYPVRTEDRRLTYKDKSKKKLKAIMNQKNEEYAHYKKVLSKDKVQAEAFWYDDELLLNKVFIADPNDEKGRDKQLFIMENEGNISFETTRPIPEEIYKIGNTNQFATMSYIYQYKRFSAEMVANIIEASKYARVEIVVPILLGSLSTDKLLADLFDVKYFIERVRLVFLPVSDEAYSNMAKWTKEKYVEYRGKYYPSNVSKLVYYDGLHEPLARWRMRLYLDANTFSDREFLNTNAIRLTEKKKIIL